MSFDLRTPAAAQACEHGHAFEPHFPAPNDHQGIGASIIVRGAHSAAARAHAQRLLDDEHARRLSQRRRGKPDDEAVDLDQFEAQRVELAVVYTIGWDGFEADGKPQPYSAAAGRELYAAHPWIREQVIEEAQALGNFITPTSIVCASTPAPSGP